MDIFVATGLISPRSFLLELRPDFAKASLITTGVEAMKTLRVRNLDGLHPRDALVLLRSVRPQTTGLERVAVDAVIKELSLRVGERRQVRKQKKMRETLALDQRNPFLLQDAQIP